MLSHYVDDTFLVGSHGLEELHGFLDFLNGICKNMLFIMELEKDGGMVLRFICVPQGRWNTGKKGLKATHRNLYLNSMSYHPPAHKNSVLSTLVHTARCVVSDPHSLPAELEFLRVTFLQKGSSKEKVTHALPRPLKVKQKDCGKEQKGDNDHSLV